MRTYYLLSTVININKYNDKQERHSPYPKRAQILVREKTLCRLYSNVDISSVQLLRHVRLFSTPWTAACQTSLSITNSQSLLKLLSMESVMPSNHLILCHPLLLPPSIFPSSRVISNESVPHIRWPKYWSSSFSIEGIFIPSNEYSVMISFTIDYFDLLIVQVTLNSLLQHNS